MKRLTLFLSLLLICINSNVFAQRQWQWISPTPQTNTLRAICPVDSSSFFACGNIGMIVHGDLNYPNSFVTTQIGGTLNGISFWNRSHGIVIGAKFIAMTSDGGRTWDPQINSVTSADNWEALCFSPDSIIFCVGQNGNIISSSDGGKKWQFKKADSALEFWRIQFVSKKVGFILGGMVSKNHTTILKTTDGGENWLVFSQIGNCTPNSMHFLNSQEGIIAGGPIYKTYDGGKTWTQKYSEKTSFFTQLNFITDSMGFACTSSNFGDFSVTFDKGETWTSIAPKLSGVNQFATFLGNGEVVTTSDYQLYRSEDTCKTWTLLGSEISPKGFSDVSFSKDGTGFAVAGSGVIARSRNRGISWKITPTGLDTTLFNSISLLNGKRAVAVGNVGVIVMTNDSGNSWIKKESNTLSELYSVRFLNDSNLVTCGADGTILRSTNGGESWIQSETPLNSRFYSLGFANSNIGFVGSLTNEIFKTIDGGKNWSKLGVSGTNRITSISCLDTMNIVAVGDLGTVLKTDDGGSDWTKISTHNSDYYSHVQFVDSSYIHIIGDGADSFYSEDAGNTWLFDAPTDPNSTSSSLFSGYNFSRDTEVIVGSCILISPPAFDTSWYPPFDTSWTAAIDSTADTTTSSVRIKSLSRSLVIYPNPVYKNIQLEINTDAPGNLFLSVYDEKGISVSQKSYPNLIAGKNDLYWDPEFLPDGNYFFNGFINNISYKGKVIIQR